MTPSTTIYQLMFRNGLADRGGAMRCTGGASPVIRGCWFASNVARDPDSCSYGGALFVDRHSDVLVEECIFLRNFADLNGGGSFDGSGGAICVWNGARVVVRRSRFENNIAAGFEGGWGGAVILMQATGTFEDCVFADNSGYAGGGAILARTGLTVERCTFVHNAAGAISCLEHSVAYCSPPGTVPAASRIERSIFHDNGGGFGGAGVVVMEGHGTVSANTLAFNQGGGALGVSPEVGVDHNIVVRNAGFGIYCNAPHAAGTIACNDVWANDGGNYGGACPDLTGTDDNISLDPLFCGDDPARDLRLRVQSPCTEDHSTCGQIGALGAGCEVIGVPAAPRMDATVMLAPAPTPTGGNVTIAFLLAAASPVRLEVYDPAGRRIAVLADRWFEAGRHEIVWSGSGSRADARKPGVYLAVLRIGEAVESRRLVIVR